MAAAGVDRFALLGTSEGGATAITYAARHPDRVSHLILHGAFGQLIEDARERERRAALMTLIRQGWGSDAAVFRQVFTGMFLPDGDAEQVRYFNEMQRVSASPEMAARCLGSFSIKWGTVPPCDTGGLEPVRDRAVNLRLVTRAHTYETSGRSSPQGVASLPCVMQNRRGRLASPR